MVSSARNPNESYADRARKASTSRSTQHAQQQHQPVNSTSSSTAPSSLKPPQVNVWAERIKEQQAHVDPQPAQMLRHRASSSPQPSRDDAIHPQSPPPNLSAQLAILDQQDEHDPFVVRVPSHLSRQSSSSTNPLPTTDPNAWPLPGTASHSNPSSAGYDSPYVSNPPSRQNSTASVRHNAYSASGSVRLSRVQSFSRHSRSASHSRAQSGSGSSASSPRLQVRGRLPQDDSLSQDLRLDNQLRRSSNKRSSPGLPDPPSHMSSSLQIEPTLPSADPSYYRRPPLQDMPPRYFLPQYALPPCVPHSGQGTPPYPHYPPYPTYMYRHGHPPFVWGDIPPQSLNHFQNQPSIPLNHASNSEHPIQHKIEFGTISPLITTGPSASKHSAEQLQNGSRPLKSVVFGTINPTESHDDPIPLPSTEEHRTDNTVEHASEQFATFSIGVSPAEPGPSRNASRKSSVKSLSRTPAPQANSNDSATGADKASPPSREINGLKKSIKWEFGTTLSEDLDNPQPLPSPLLTSVPPLTKEMREPLNPPPSYSLPANRPMDKSETGSTASDVWVVKDYGYGFGNQSAYGSALDNVRWEVQEGDPAQDGHREREMLRDQFRDRSWLTTRQLGWRHENAVEETREGWEQQVRTDVPRYMRQRRGSLSSFAGQERGGFAGRRGRGFGGRFHGIRGRGGFFHHQRPGSHAHPQASQPVPAAIDTVNGYGHYALPELELHEPVRSASEPRVFTPTIYSVDVMRNCLLGQLEYYLSPQNMAQDFYLRQRMDNQGWIPISLLASFKRVQQLHTNADIVRQVLSQSAVVEVSGDWVRMGGRQWEVFVLPNAQRSVVKGDPSDDNKDPSPSASHQDSDVGENEGDHGEIEGDCEGEDCDGDDEDDDIEFVIGEEAEGSWMPLPERKY